MTLRSAVVVAAVGVLCGFGAVSVRGQVINPEAPQVLRPDPGVTPPEVIKRQDPKYTEAAIRRKIQGNVELEAVIRTDGTVGDIAVVKSLDDKYGLDEEAIKAAKAWRFKPGMKGGKPVNVSVKLVLTFRLKDAPLQHWAPAEPHGGHVASRDLFMGTGADPTSARALYEELTARTASPSGSGAYTSATMRHHVAAADAVAQAADDEFVRGTYAEATPGLVKPRIVRQPEPKYTSDALRAKIQGDVIIDAVVGTDGTVTRARVTQSLDAQFGLDEEALKAVKQWIFVPGTLKGQAVPVLVRLVLTFRLH